MPKQKGRKALPGTYEAREFVTKEDFNEWILSCPVSIDGQKRIERAIKFGLGIKEV